MLFVFGRGHCTGIHKLAALSQVTLSSVSARAGFGARIGVYAQGALQGGAGLMEMRCGVAFIATAASMSNPISAGATALIGIGGVLHGWDNYSTGAQQVFSGSYQSSSTVEFLKGLGFSEQFAEGIDGTATMLLSSEISLNQAERFAARELAKNSRLHLENFPSKDFNFAKTPTQANGEFYSVAFETEISSTSYPGLSRYRHFQEANSALLNLMERNKEFPEMMNQLGINLERTATGLAHRVSPIGWTWHHVGWSQE